MEFRRSGQLDDRRRRVLMDEIAAPPEDADASSPAPGSKGPVRAYAPAVLDERQARVTDLVPVRPLAVAAWLFLAALGIAGIQAAYVYSRPLVPRDPAGQLAALDPLARGSLAGWYASALLGVALGWSLVVFGVRAHRVDDYRGRYRVWLWAAAALGLLALDAATGLHDALGWALTLAGGKQVLTASPAAAATMAWMGLYGLVLGTLALRVAIEVWPSIGSFTALLLSLLLYLVAGMMQLGLLVPTDPLAAAVSRSAIALTAHWALVAAVGLFARHVILDARGRLKVHIDPERKKSRAKSRARLKVMKSEKAAESAPQAPTEQPAATATASRDAARFGAGAAGAKASASVSKAALTSPEAEADDADDDSDTGLSRSERRRMKKLARREQRRAA